MMSCVIIAMIIIIILTLFYFIVHVQCILTAIIMTPHEYEGFDGAHGVVLLHAWSTQLQTSYWCALLGMFTIKRTQRCLLLFFC